MGKYKPGTTVEFSIMNGVYNTGSIVRYYPDDGYAPIYYAGVEYSVSEDKIREPKAPEPIENIVTHVLPSPILYRLVLSKEDKRDILAAFLACGVASSGKYDGEYRIAHEAIKIADALIKELSNVNDC